MFKNCTRVTQPVEIKSLQLRHICGEEKEKPKFSIIWYNLLSVRKSTKINLIFLRLCMCKSIFNEGIRKKSFAKRENTCRTECLQMLPERTPKVKVIDHQLSMNGHPRSFHQSWLGKLYQVFTCLIIKSMHQEACLCSHGSTKIHGKVRCLVKSSIILYNHIFHMKNPKNDLNFLCNNAEKHFR